MRLPYPLWVSSHIEFTWAPVSISFFLDKSNAFYRSELLQLKCNFLDLWLNEQSYNETSLHPFQDTYTYCIASKHKITIFSRYSLNQINVIV